MAYLPEIKVICNLKILYELFLCDNFYVIVANLSKVHIFYFVQTQPFLIEKLFSGWLISPNFLVKWAYSWATAIYETWEWSTFFCPTEKSFLRQILFLPQTHPSPPTRLPQHWDHQPPLYLPTIQQNTSCPNYLHQQPQSLMHDRSTVFAIGVLCCSLKTFFDKQMAILSADNSSRLITQTPATSITSCMVLPPL